MKAISELNLPDDVRYTDDHEWAKNRRRRWCAWAFPTMPRISWATSCLWNCPKWAARFDKGEEFGTVESVKAVSELYMPIGGEVTAVNESLADAARTGQQRSLTMAVG
jgi:glycine cleavage system H protein